MDRIDLHTHSTFSDGTFTPAELLRYAKEKGVRTIAITDHDTISGLSEGAAAAAELGVEFINGVELATVYGNIEIHILGLFIDSAYKPFQDALNAMAEKRAARNEEMIKRLETADVFIAHDDLLNHTKKNLITRAHFARALVDKGYCATFPEAFSKYLSPGCVAFLPRQAISIPQTIDLIHAAGGLAVLAHPLLYKLDYTAVETLVSHLQNAGLDAIEGLYATNTMADDIFLSKLAKKYRLKVTGGSDFHGQNKPHIDIGVGCGHLFVPYTVLTALKQV